jgi:hypothetical protein
VHLCTAHRKTGVMRRAKSCQQNEMFEPLMVN